MSYREGDYVSKNWFLPETPDVMATLHQQAEVTIKGMEAFAQWASGLPEQSSAIREAEHEADTVRRELAQQLRIAFTTPVDQEDLFTLSERLDSIINAAKNVVREAELLEFAPTSVTADMANEAVQGVKHIATAFAALIKDPDEATKEADAATKSGRHMEKRYSTAMRETASEPDLRTAVIMREHFRQCLAIGERIELVADRIWYSVVKEQ